MWKKIIKRDSYVIGVLFGLLFPMMFYLALYLLDLVVVEIFETHMLAKQEYLYLLSIAINLFAIKYYFVNLKYEKTGRSILLVTFVLAILYFIIQPN